MQMLTEGCGVAYNNCYSATTWSSTKAKELQQGVDS